MALGPKAPLGSSRANIKQLPGGIIVDVPWIRDLNALGIVVSAIFSILPVWLLVTDFMYGWPMALLLSPVLYSVVCSMVNRTTFVVARGGVDISHGPLPSLSKARILSPQGARQLRLQRRETRTNRGATMVTYDLVGPDGVISSRWNHLDGLDSALAAVERVFEIPRRPMSDVPMGVGWDHPLVPMALAGVAVVVLLGFRPTGYAAHERIVTDLFHLPDGVEFTGFRSGWSKNEGEYIEAVVQFTPEQWSAYTPGFGLDPADFHGFDLGRTPVEGRPTAEALRWRDLDDAVIDYERDVAVRWARWGWVHDHLDGGEPGVYSVARRRSFCFGVEGEGEAQQILPCTAFEHRPVHYVRALLDEDGQRLFVNIR